MFVTLHVLGTFDHLIPSTASHAPRPSPSKQPNTRRTSHQQPPTNKLDAFPENLQDYMRGALEMTEGGGGGQKKYALAQDINIVRLEIQH